MRNGQSSILAGLLLAVGVIGPASAQSAAPVTVQNFIRAESDTYMTNAMKDGGLGKLLHRREPASLANQIIIRLNRDTLYSSGVFDLDAGPVTITLPDAGKRFMSLQAISQDHYAKTFYGAQPQTFTRDNVSTRYVMFGVRTLVDPADPQDLREVHALQDAIKVSQQGTGKFEVPNWDQAGLKAVREPLLRLSAHTGGFKNAFGAKGEVDPVLHLIATAAGWGGNADKDATYLSGEVPKNDGKSVYRLSVGDVPVDAFWSVTVYNAKGYLEPNRLNAYSLNNITAKKSEDGKVDIQFGGCDGKVPNCLPVTDGWNYTVRLYRPRAEILNGTWTFPAAQPVN